MDQRNRELHLEDPQDKRESLTAVSNDYWETLKRNEPVYATSLGDRRYDDRLADITLEHRKKTIQEYQSLIQRAKRIAESNLTESEKQTKTALLVELQSQIDHLECWLEDWVVDPLRGPQVDFLNIESLQPVRNPNEAAMMVRRWRAMAPYLRDHMENLSRGLSEGKISISACIEKVIEEVRDLLSKPEEEWALLHPLKVKHENWSEDEREKFSVDLTGSMRDLIRPAFAQYYEFLNFKILPHARTAQNPGIMHVPGGADAYRRLIKMHTSLGLLPEEIHRTGLVEVAKINREMGDVGEKVFGTRNRKEILNHLRTDPTLFFSTRDDIAQKAEKALAKAKAAIPKWFGRLPLTDCEVVRMEEHEEKHSTIAYYMPAAADGSRPGRYYINTYAPETRPRYEAEALAYHESIPGHHLQIAISQELKDIPEFRKQSGVTAFVEGWGLYTERLANEMGLYTSDIDRIGMLSYDSWRACRLVVDTGMHAMGWSRDRAIEFMWENSALAKNNIVNEVDRYICWPGQALAYKTGQLAIIGLRNRAESMLGDHFDISEFHDALLNNGALPLKALENVIDRYVMLKRGEKSG